MLNKYNQFFSVEKRSKQSTQEIDYSKVARVIREDLYSKYNDLMFKPINDTKDCLILEHLLSGEIKGIGQITCDDIICHYLDSIKIQSNETYFIFVVKFVLLFRECFNLSERTKKESYASVEFTSRENAELFPEQCNQFFSDFMETNNFFGFDEEEKTELIEIIQHFCFWLFMNKYTQSKLSLAG